MVEEFEDPEKNEAGINIGDGRDIEILKEFKVEKAKVGFTAWPCSKIQETIPSGLVI